MNAVLLILIAVSVLAIAVFLIPLLIEAKRTFVSLRKSTEENLNPAFDELKIILRNIRGITEKVNGITEDIEELSSSVNEAGRTISGINELVRNVSSSATVKIFSLRAALKAAFEYLLTNLIKKGGRK